MSFGSGYKASALKRQDRARGALLGGAIGDALGAPVEFMSRDLILATYGKYGIEHYDRAYGRRGAITDDTQLTLMTALGLLDAGTALAVGDVNAVLACVCRRYIDWFRHQQGETTELDWHHPVADAVAESLSSYRSPGCTCIRELAKMGGEPRIERADNDSKGNGGIMRVAPVALAFAGGHNESLAAFYLSSDIAGLTHGHPAGFLAAGAFSVILHAVVNGSSLHAAAAHALTVIDGMPGGLEVDFYLRLALRLVEENVSPARALASVGRGNTADEALCIALYSALVAKDFDSAVRLAVNHDGDSDTTGSLTGQLYGALVGCNGIDSHWIAPLELHTDIEMIAAALSST